MTEFAKYIRFLFQSFIFINLAIIVFSFSSDPAQKYENALSDIKYLENTNFEEYALYMAENNKIDKRHFSSSSAVGLQKYFDTIDYRKCICADSFKVNGELNLLIIPDKRTSIIKHYYDFLNNGPIINFGVPSITIYKALSDNGHSCQSLIENNINELIITTSDNRIKLLNSLLISKEGYRVFLKEGSQNNICLIQYYEIVNLGYNLDKNYRHATSFMKDFMNEDISFLLSGINSNQTNSFFYINLESPVFASVIYTEFANDWMNTLFEGTNYPLKNIDLVLDEIENFTLNNCKRYLEREIENQSKRTEIFGLSIDKNIALWLIPILLFSLIIYIYVHIKGFENYLEKNNLELESYPIILFFKSKISMTISFLSLIALPVFTLLFFFLKISSSSNRIIYGLLVSSLFLVVSIITFYKIQHIKNKYV